MALVLLLGFTLLLLAWLVGEPSYVRWRRRRIASRPFPAAWRWVLQRRVPLYRRLPADLQLQLKRRIQVFVAEKPPNEPA